MLCVGREKALVIAGNATLTEKSRGTRETPSPITNTAKLFKRLSQRNPWPVVDLHSMYVDFEATQHGNSLSSFSAKERGGLVVQAGWL